MGLGTISWLAVGAGGQPPAANRPNPLVIIADDQSTYHLRIDIPIPAWIAPVFDQLESDGMVFSGPQHAVREAVLARYRNRCHELVTELAQ
ncbi:hypothetical protein [Aporhodopirellula aestuarii]|uniref:Uncharacterized protein n=1 Tax=Aporhodopirellula aestuarii TaxID=2950107 RepID=A0ABT0U173_9BACT|nr:hypothetical protein [Aporhodopirellula aestuarii]MCM2370238.1 hypothetical protein [Aporhodopirellula aestuarii]